MKYVEEEELYEVQQLPSAEEEYGCKFCWDRRKKKNKELFFLDAANNMRVCLYCPWCGRSYTERPHE